MIKKYLATFVFVTAGLFANASQATVCGAMSIQSVASADTGPQVWLVNQTGVACGAVPAGGAYLFNLVAGEERNKMFATLLTAASLGNVLWTSYDDSTNPGTLSVIAMSL